VTVYPDDVLIDRLEYSAALIESLTQQVFGPVYKTVPVNGLGQIYVEEPYRNKIIELVAVQHLSADGTLTPLSANTYVVDERRVQLRPFDKSPWAFDRAFRAFPDNRFPYDYQNVRFTATFGWLDLDVKIETTLTSALSLGGVTLDLGDTTDLGRNDLLLIDRRFWVIVGAVPTPGVVEIDPSPKSAAVGSSVIRYGQVPRLVREAVVRTVLANVSAPGSDEETGADERKRMRREETDNYEVEFFEGVKGGKVFAGTGDPRADAILSRFRASAVTGSWV
jgi:hypothetical protein